MNKTCKRCHKVKPLSEYGSHKTTHDKLRPLCKTCHRAYNRDRMRKLRNDPKFRDLGIKQHNEWVKKNQEAGDLEFAMRLRITNKRCECKKKDLAFDLDLEWCLEQISKGCPITGRPFDGNKDSPMYPSIDRIQPKLGYIKSNCRMVALCFNLLRSDWSDEEVLSIFQPIRINNAVL